LCVFQKRPYIIWQLPEDHLQTAWDGAVSVLAANVCLLVIPKSEFGDIQSMFLSMNEVKEFIG